MKTLTEEFWESMNNLAQNVNGEWSIVNEQYDLFTIDHSPFTIHIHETSPSNIQLSLHFAHPVLSIRDLTEYRTQVQIHTNLFAVRGRSLTKTWINQRRMVIH